MPERIGQRSHLTVAADEWGEPARCRRLQAGSRRGRAPQLVDDQGFLDALDRHFTDAGDLDVSFGELERMCGQEDTTGGCKLLHPRGKMRALSDRSVVHVEIVADRPHHDLSGVEPNPDAERHVCFADRLGETRDGVPHPQSGVAAAQRVVLVRHRRAEEGHDTVAHDLVHRTFVPMNGFHHPL